jgi:ABC-type transport system involved in multi-copper enzyme maturation permease subunit
MLMRWGLGPVFVHESIAATRRWQLFVLRSLFVLGLLAGLAIAWIVFFAGFRPEQQLTIKQLAMLGEYFYDAIASVQLTLVLLIAPVATADAICLDRARGNLVHLFATDLSSAEIVLGKLAARLVPVFGLVAATVPVLALAGLLGGIMLEAIVRLTVITLVLAVLGCSLALAVSVRATKTNEVLMAVYGIEGLWVLGPFFWLILFSSGLVPQVPQWCWEINPYIQALAPYIAPGQLGLARVAAFFGGVLALAAALVVYAVLRIRAEPRNRARQRAARRSSALARSWQRLSARRPRPSLDDNPVLWREWCQARPSRLSKVVWGGFGVLALAGTAVGIVRIAENHEQGLEFLGFVNGFQATFGLLLLSLVTPTVLAEERVRGSLDVLLASPLATRRIVLAKWRGAYRAVPALAVLPTIGALCIAASDPRLSAGSPSGSHELEALNVIDRMAIVGIPAAMLLAQGALITSAGLALATWCRRVSRAVALCVASYAFVAFGWIVLLETGVVTTVLSRLGLLDPKDGEAETFANTLLAYICPFGAQYLPFEIADGPAPERILGCLEGVIMLLATLAVALLLLALTLLTFDRCLGRVPERPRRAPRPPRRLAASPAIACGLASLPAGGSDNLQPLHS